MGWDLYYPVYLDPAELPDDLVRELEKEYPALDEIEMIVEAKGYEDPGVCSGPPERCYPPEGDDERFLNDIKLRCGKKPWVSVRKECFERIKGHAFWEQEMDKLDIGDFMQAAHEAWEGALEQRADWEREERWLRELDKQGKGW
jgi:hypothetical protein